MGRLGIKAINFAVTDTTPPRAPGAPPGNRLIQINAAARLPPRVVHGIKTDFQYRGCRDRHHRSQRGCARRRPVVRLVNAGCAGRADHWRQHAGRVIATLLCEAAFLLRSRSLLHSMPRWVSLLLRIGSLYDVTMQGSNRRVGGLVPVIHRAALITG